MSQQNTKNKKWEMCNCGHLGGMSPDDITQHMDHLQLGHGPCTRCGCHQFTWAGFCDRDGNIEA